MSSRIRVVAAMIEKDGKYLITQHLYSRLEYRHDESEEAHVFSADHGKKLLEGQDIVSVEFTYLFN